MNTVVSCRYGTLQGIQENGCAAFYNVPYAQGAGRFRCAAEPAPWQGIYDAAKPGPLFPQNRSRLHTVMGEQENLPQDENAFALNIWTPDTGGNYPVLLWIHGGGWLTGGAGLSWYNGSNLAREGIVVISVQYRLGVMGNLYLPEISDGNLAVHDLVSAIAWIKENISAFGGDASCLTIAGQSAGAWYAAALLGIKELRGTFKRAILCSFPGGIEPLSREDALQMSTLLQKELHINDIHALERVPVQDLLAAQSRVSEEMQRRKNQMMAPVFLPYADHQWIQDDIIAAAAENCRDTVSILAGITGQETMAFLNSSPISNRRQIYQAIVKMSTQHIFLNPVLALMNRFSANGSRVYAYQFDYPCRNKKIQACHCIDLPFLFGNFECWKNAPMCDFASEGDSAKEAGQLSVHLQSALVQFVKDGTPKGRIPVEWPAYRAESKMVLRFQPQARAAMLEKNPLTQRQIAAFLQIGKWKSRIYMAFHKD